MKRTPIFTNSPIKILFILIVFSVFGCDDDDFGPDYIITSDGFQCQDYAYFDLTEGNESIRELRVYGDNVFYTNFDDEIKAYSIRENRTTILSDDKPVWDIDYAEGKLYFCTRRGIYSVEINDLSSFTQVSPYSCESIGVADAVSVYFTGFNHSQGMTFTSPSSIYRLDTDGSVSAFSERLINDQLEAFSVLSNGSVLAYNQLNASSFFRFDPSGTLTHTFDADNSPIGTGNLGPKAWTKVVENRYIVALKNGSGIPRLVEWNEDDMAWHSYIDPEIIESEKETSTEKVFDIIAPSYTDLAVDGDLVYITTSFAGCRGIQRISITEGVPVAFADIEIIQDEGLEIGHCVQGIQLDPSGNSKYIYSQKGLMILRQCQ